jgi:phage terminase small subunit
MPLFDPAKLGDKAREAYSTAVATLESLGEVPKDSENALHRFALAVDDEDRIRGEWDDWARPVVCMGGSTGRQLATHPLLAALDQADKRVARTAKELGLTPDARSGLKSAGRPRGTSQSPDRQQLRRAA